MTRAFFIFWIVFQGVSYSSGQQQNSSFQQEKQSYCLSLAKQYCHDAYNILKSDVEAKFTRFINGKTKEEWAVSLETAVHETCHSLNFYIPHDRFSSFGYFITGDLSIECEGTSIFNSSELNDYIPKSIRSQMYRYDTYIGDGNREISSKKDGIYGLLDEFCAYYHGIRCDLDLREAGILKSHIPVQTSWSKNTRQGTRSGYTIQTMESNMLDSYYEFRLFISWYLQYAHEQYPDIYQSIYENRQFREAYTLLDYLFAGMVQEIRGNEHLIDYFPTPSEQLFTTKDLEELERFRLKGVTLDDFR